LSKLNVNFNDISIDGKLVEIKDNEQIKEMEEIYDVNLRKEDYEHYDDRYLVVMVEKIDDKIVRIFDYTLISNRKLLWSRYVNEYNLDPKTDHDHIYEQIIQCPKCDHELSIADDYHLEEYKKALSENNLWAINYHGKEIYCWDCRELNFLEEKRKEQLEEQQDEQKRQEAIKEINKIHESEPNSNLYCEKIKSRDYHYSYANETGESHKVYYTRIDYQFKCGKKFNGSHNSDYTLESATKEHITSFDCKICRYLIRGSKATIMRQDEVTRFFEMGIDGKKTATNNLSSEDGILLHYSTMEEIRLNNVDGKVINLDNIKNFTKDSSTKSVNKELLKLAVDKPKFILISNSQCWSEGYASCPRTMGVISLPLTTLDSIVPSGYSVKEIEILDYISSDENLVKIGNDYYLAGRDDQDFLVKLIKPVNNIKEAYETLKPIEVNMAEKQKLQVLRQGDLFFIPTKVTFTNYDKTHFVPDWNKISYQDREDFKQQLALEMPTRFGNVSTEGIGLNIIKQVLDNENDASEKIKDQLIDKYSFTRLQELAKMIVNKNKMLKRCQIFDTNHNAQNLAKENDSVFVKGSIIHANREHNKMVLNSWHKVLRNTTSGSYNLTTERRHSGGWRGD
jgi:hypothetical protein